MACCGVLCVVMCCGVFLFVASCVVCVMCVGGSRAAAVFSFFCDMWRDVLWCVSFIVRFLFRVVDGGV